MCKHIYIYIYISYVALAIDPFWGLAVDPFLGDEELLQPADRGEAEQDGLVATGSSQARSASSIKTEISSKFIGL